MPPDRTHVEAAIAQSTGQLLLKAARLLDETALARIRAEPGAPPIRPAHTRLFPHLSVGGIRITTIAARLGVTKQAVAALVADLMDWGMVEQVPDPTDGRARLVRYSEQGYGWLMHGLGMLASLEREVAHEVGPEAMATFKQVLAAWLARLEREPSP